MFSQSDAQCSRGACVSILAEGMQKTYLDLGRRRDALAEKNIRVQKVYQNIRIVPLTYVGRATARGIRLRMPSSPDHNLCVVAGCADL